MARCSSILPVLGTLLFLAGCDDKPSPQVIYGTLERERLELSFETNEPVVSIQVREGDQVHRGDVLMQQDQSRSQLALDYAQAQYKVVKARLSAAEFGPRKQEIERARARVNAAQSVLNTSNLELQRAQELIDHNFADQNEVDVLQGRSNEAKARVEEAEAALAELMEGTRNELLDEARHALEQAQARINNLDLSLERTSLIAPRNGTVEAVLLEQGERPVPNRAAVILAVHNTAHARIYIPEPLRTRLKPGMVARVTIDGYPDAFPASLRWVSSTAAFSPYFSLNQQDRARLAYLAEVDLVTQSIDTANLPSGMPVEVTFDATSDTNSSSGSN